MFHLSWQNIIYSIVLDRPFWQGIVKVTSIVICLERVQCHPTVIDTVSCFYLVTEGYFLSCGKKYTNQAELSSNHLTQRVMQTDTNVHLYSPTSIFTLFLVCLRPTQLRYILLAFGGRGLIFSYVHLAKYWKLLEVCQYLSCTALIQQRLQTRLTQ